MKLDAIDSALPVLDRHRRCIGRGGADTKAFRELSHPIPMAHPHRLLRRQPVEKHAGLDHIDLRPTVLSMLGAFDLPAELVGRKMHAVTDPQDRNPELENGGIHLRRVRLVDALRPTRENHSDGVLLPNLLRAEVEGLDHAVDPVLPHPAGDQLGVLAAKIQDDDGLMAAWRLGRASRIVCHSSRSHVKGRARI
jgi:hypothetical protein